jgi:lipocalin
MRSADFAPRMAQLVASPDCRNGFLIKRAEARRKEQQYVNRIRSIHRAGFDRPTAILVPDRHAGVDAQ